VVDWIEITNLDSLPEENEAVLIRLGWKRISNVYAVAFIRLCEFDGIKYPQWIDNLSQEIIDEYTVYPVTHYARFEYLEL